MPCRFHGTLPNFNRNSAGIITGIVALTNPSLSRVTMTFGPKEPRAVKKSIKTFVSRNTVTRTLRIFHENIHPSTHRRTYLPIREEGEDFRTMLQHASTIHFPLCESWILSLERPSGMRGIVATRENAQTEQLCSAAFRQAFQSLFQALRMASFTSLSGQGHHTPEENMT